MLVMMGSCTHRNCSYGFLCFVPQVLARTKGPKEVTKSPTPRKGSGKVHVRRGGEPKVICESELVWGDILLIKKGDEVPCDGLFVGGEPLELDYGSESCTVNQHNPFLSFGERVVKGEARMVVTSPYLETEWSEMMSKDSGPPRGGSN
ncbi:putative P-type Ca(2+) transporter [Helianthus annuus]|nr:putative P-type Ca(2+) transporter [Helianthus annuus]